MTDKQQRLTLAGAPRLSTSGVRLCLAAFAILTASALHVRSPGLSLLWLVFVVAGAVLAVLTVRAEPSSTSGARGVTSALVILGVVINVLLLESRPAALPAVIICVVCSAGLAVWAVNQRRPVRFLLDPAVYFIAVYAVLMGAWLLTHPHHIDVVSVQEDAVQALLAGDNPYLATYRNIYSPEEMLLFYGPNFSPSASLPAIPYPPSTFLLAVLGYLIGDVRSTGLVLMAALCLVLVRLKDERRRPLGVLLLLAPGSAWMYTGGWTEAFIVPLLGAAILAAWHRKFLLTSVTIGVVLVSKQYFVVVLPCLWLLRSYWSWRRVLLLIGAAAVVTLPWLVADYSNFLRSVVSYGLAAPIRFDSLSVFVEIARYHEISDGVALRWLPGAMGLLAAIVLAITFRPRADTFLVAVAISLLVTFLCSKQAFQNYYYLIGATVLLAAWDSRYLLGGPSSENAFEKVEDAEAARQPVKRTLR